VNLRKILRITKLDYGKGIAAKFKEKTHELRQSLFTEAYNNTGVNMSI
jgi:hypothetical protein